MNSKVDVMVSDILNNINKKNYGRNIFLFAMGMFLSALAFNLFFEPYNVISNGSNGFSFLIAYLTKLDISLVTLIINLLLMFLGLVFFGLDYSVKMLPYTFLYPLFLKFTTLITKLIDLENTSLFLIVVIGGALLGFSTGLVRKSGFKLSGFSIVYDIMNKYFYISVGTATLIINVLMIIASGFIFGFENAVYAIISLLVSTHIVDKVIIGISDNKVFYIVTEKPLEIRDYIIDKLHYSVTLINARGGYSNKKKKMLMCVVSTIEYLKLKELVSVIDPKVFFLIVDIYESSVKKNCKYM